MTQRGLDTDPVLGLGGRVRPQAVRQTLRDFVAMRGPDANGSFGPAVVVAEALLGPSLVEAATVVVLVVGAGSIGVDDRRVHFAEIWERGGNGVMVRRRRFGR